MGIDEFLFSLNFLGLLYYACWHLGNLPILMTYCSSYTFYHTFVRANITEDNWFVCWVLVTILLPVLYVFPKQTTPIEFISFLGWHLIFFTFRIGAVPFAVITVLLVVVASCARQYISLLFFF